MPKGHPVASKSYDCLGGGGTHPEADLLRFVVGPDGKIYLDLTGKLTGKAAYVLPKKKYINAALASMPQALELDKAPDSAQVLAEVKAQLTKRFLGSLGLARKSGGVVLGTDKVCENLQKGYVTDVILATDTAEHTASKVKNLAYALGAKIFSVADRESLSTALGQKNCAVVGILDKPQARPIFESAARLQGLMK